MPIQNSLNGKIINSAKNQIFSSTSEPTPSTPGDTWIENGAFIGEHIWIRTGNNKWGTPYKQWDFQGSFSSAQTLFFRPNAWVDNWSLDLRYLNLTSRMAVAATTSNRWTFRVSTASATNTLTQLGQSQNTGAAANAWLSQGISLQTVVVFPAASMLVIDLIPNSTIQPIFIAGSLNYQLVRN